MEYEYFIGILYVTIAYFHPNIKHGGGRLMRSVCIRYNRARKFVFTDGIFKR